MPHKQRVVYLLNTVIACGVAATTNATNAVDSPLAAVAVMNATGIRMRTSAVRRVPFCLTVHIVHCAMQACHATRFAG